jgi:methyltransferase (TIGR00027 family)
MGESSVMAWVVTVRTVMIDRFIRQAIDRGVDTVLNLGAGLDTRPYRLDLPEKLRWIEVDFPSVISYKTLRLDGESPKCDLERIALDLANVEERARLFDRIAAGSGQVLVLTEGVVPYLANDAVAALAGDLLAHRNFRYWIADYYSPTLLTRFRGGKLRRRLGTNAPFKFAPGNWEKFFAAAGWKLKEVRYFVEEGVRLGRLPPGPWIFRLLFRFLPKKKREELMKMSGYGLLERTGMG